MNDRVNFTPTRFSLPGADRLTEVTSRAIADSLQRQEIGTPLTPAPIATAYVQQGQGQPPILLLHGFDSSLFEFRRLVPLLSQAHATWAIDLLGFGLSDRAVGLNAGLQFSAAEIVTHLYYTWKTLIGQPVVLVAASMGGAAAIQLALAHPEVVAKLVLIDSAGFAKPPVMGKFLVPPLGYLAAEFLRSPRVRRNVSLQAYADPIWVSADAELCAALHTQQPHWREAIIRFTQSGGFPYLGDRLDQLTQPTLILWGERDRILGTDAATKFQHAIAGSQLIWIPECGHVPHLEKPHSTAAHILEFVGRSSEASATIG